MAERTVIRNATVFVYNGLNHVPYKTDLFFDNQILGFSDDPPLSGNIGGFNELDMEGMIIGPGFIDTHLHGGGDGLNCIAGSYSKESGAIDGGPGREVIEGILRAHAKYGTTTLFLSTLAVDKQYLTRFLDCVRDIKENPLPDGEGALIGGIDFEGTYLCPSEGGAYVGALDSDYMYPPDVDDFRSMVGDNEHLVKKVAIGFDWPAKGRGPKAKGGDPIGLAVYLAQQGIMPCIGHSGASKEQVLEAVGNAGSMVFIHYGNGPNKSCYKAGFESTMEAIPCAAEMIEQGCFVYVEQILDNNHVAPSFTAHAYKLFGPDNIIGVTDNMAITGRPSFDSFRIGQTRVDIDLDRKALWIAGKKGKSLAGSMATANDLFRNSVGMFNHPSFKNIYTNERMDVENDTIAMNRAFKMLSTNPARAYQLHDRGYIKEGARADLVAIDPAGRVVKEVWVGGCPVKNYDPARSAVRA